MASMKTEEEVRKNTGKLTRIFLLGNSTQRVEQKDLNKQYQGPSWSLLKNGAFQDRFHGKACEQESSVSVPSSHC